MNPLALLAILAICAVALAGIGAVFGAPAHYGQTNPRNAQYDTRHHD